MKSNKYQIYLITKRKKFFFDRCEHFEDYNLSSFYLLNESHDKEWLKVKHPKNQYLRKSDIIGYTTVVTDGNPIDVRDFTVINNLQPYRELSGDTSAYGNMISTIWPSDMEVVYIGQSFGNMKTRIAKHEKIKDVALRVIDESSNEEIIVVCVAFDVNNNVFAMVRPNSTTDFSPKGLNEIRKKAIKRVSAQQQVTLYEASLIAYFKPYYNTEYKETFLSRGFTSYGQIYNTDFNYVSATLVIPEELKTRIWSQHIQQPAFTHSDHFPLETQGQKRTLFDFIYDNCVSV